MTSAALHARENASMPPRERHGRPRPIVKAGISASRSESDARAWRLEPGGLPFCQARANFDCFGLLHAPELKLQIA